MIGTSRSSMPNFDKILNDTLSSDPELDLIWDSNQLSAIKIRHIIQDIRDYCYDILGKHHEDMRDSAPTLFNFLHILEDEESYSSDPDIRIKILFKKAQIMFMSKFDDISVDEWSVQIIRHLTKHFMRPIFWFEHNGIEKFEFENLKDKELAVAKLALEATSFPPLSLTCSFDHYTIYRSGYEDCYIFARKLYILWKETFNKSDPMDLYNEVISHIADRFTKANLKGEIPNAVQED